MLNTFSPSVDDGWLSRLSDRLSPQESGKLIDTLLTCLASSQLAVALYDPADRLQFANTSFRGAFAIDPDTYPTWADIIRNCYARRDGLILEADDIEAWISDISTRRRSLASRTFECDLTDGRWLRMTETMTSDGWMMCVASDVTALKIHERFLQEARDSAMVAAHTDPLTGVYNRRFIFSRLYEALGHAHTAGTPLSIAVLDLDHFKDINDTYGHVAGDEILQHFARQVQRNLRPSDLLGRIGGEEFLLMLPGTSLADGEKVIERLQAAMNTAIAIPERPAVRCTFSVGLTNACPSDNVTSLFHRADQGLYAAKQGGRNRQVAFPS
jgi:diguanylate cyclase (GGDEF)-like protein